MTETKRCIFCRMVAGEIPATNVFQDDVVLAFLDIGPLSDGHTLVIPKEHYSRLHECPGDLMGQVAARLGRIAGAVVSAMGCQGYNVLCNNGVVAGQVVDHVHFHIIPRDAGDGVFDRWPSYKYPEGKIDELARRVRANL